MTDNKKFDKLDKLSDLYFDFYRQALELDDRIRAEIALEFMKYTKHLQEILCHES